MPPSRPVPIFTSGDGPHAFHEITLTSYDRRAPKIDRLGPPRNSLEVGRKFDFLPERGLVGVFHYEPGDKVGRGGGGNPGSSSEPHLHFQVEDGSAPLGSNRLPVAIDKFARYSYKLKYHAKDHRLAMTLGSRAVRDQPVMNDALGS